MKKWITVLLVLMMMFSLAACGKEAAGNDEEISIETTDEEITESSSEEVVSKETPVSEQAEELAEPSAEAPAELQAEAPAEEPTEPQKTYTYTDLDQIMYVKHTINVKSIPGPGGENLGGLNSNAEVHVTGQCNESGWYRIEYNDGIGYVSNNFLVNGKAGVSVNTPEYSNNTPEKSNNSPENFNSNPENSNSNPENPNSNSENSNNNSVETATKNSPPPIPIFDDGTKDDIDWNQYSSGNGDDLAFSGSTTLPSGLTIKTLNKFNSAGMDTSMGNSWMGDIYSDIVAQNYEAMADNFDAFNEMHNGSVINVLSHLKIGWRSSYANSSFSLEIRKADDHYKVIIWGPNLDLASAQAMGWAGIDAYHVSVAQEALTVLLSAITPDCVAIKEAIIQSVYTAPSGQEPIPVDFSWVKIGQTNIALSEYDFTNGRHICVFAVK